MSTPERAAKLTGERQHAAIAMLLAVVGSVAGALVTSALSSSQNMALGSSQNMALVGAAVGAAIPPLVAVAGPYTHLRLWTGVLIAVIALVVTYGGFTVPQKASGVDTTFPAGPTLVFVTITPTSAPLKIDQVQQFEAVATLSDKTTQDVTNQASWNSSDPQVVTVDAAGRATAKGSGSATITATHKSKEGKATLTVTGAPVVSVAITPTSASLKIGQDQQFKAVATFSDKTTQDVTKQASWSPSDPKVVTVDAAGLATAEGPGSATITAIYQGIGDISPSRLTVTGTGTVVSVAITPTSALLKIGQVQQFNAVATLSDGTTRDVTEQTSWNSNNPQVVTVDASGRATAKKTGKATITATYQDKAGKATVEVK